MSVVRLRATVLGEATSDGLLLRGYGTSSRLRGGADLTTLWTALHPALRTGVDEEALATLPAPQGAAVERLIGALHELDLLVPAGSRRGDLLPGLRMHAEGIADDPAELFTRPVVALTAPGPWRCALLPALDAAGLHVTDTERGSPRLHISITAGDRHGPTPARDGDTVPVLPVTLTSGAVLLGPADGDGDVHQRAVRRWCAASGASWSPTPPPSSLTSTAVPVIADEALRSVVRRRAPLAELVVVEPGAVRRLLLPRSPQGPTWRPLSVDELLDLASTETSQGYSVLDRMGALVSADVGVLPDPSPGTLPQLPLALARTRVHGRLVIGFGDSERDARVHALLQAVRLLPAAPPAPARDTTASGLGAVDLLADVLAQVSATGDDSPRPADLDRHTSGEVRRWSSSLRRLGAGPLTVRTGTAVLTGLPVATVRTSRWARTAVEASPTAAVTSALRGLVAAVQTATAGIAAPAHELVRVCGPAAVVAAAPALRRLADHVDLERWCGEPELDRLNVLVAAARASTRS